MSKENDQGVRDKTLKEILQQFFVIDEKIMTLHQCSSDDFLSLNKILKDNFSKAKTLTDKANSAFVLSGKTGSLKRLSELKSRFEAIHLSVIEFENQIDYTLNILEDIQGYFSLIFVPINNFRQNIASLKLLLTNIKLTNTFFDKSLKGFSDNEAAKIESAINKVKDSCPLFSENIFNLQKHVKNLYNDLSRMKDSVMGDIYDCLNQAVGELDVLIKNNENVLKKQNRLNTISKNCTKSVDSIITNLQYHDIIRQKMEHVQQTHKLLLDKINDNPDQEKEVDASVRLSYVIQVPQISDIQVAQLLHTNKEYQNAIELISEKMIEIGQDMSEVVRICKPLNVFDNNTKAPDSEVISKTFLCLSHKTRENISNYKNTCDDIIDVNSVVSGLFEKFEDISMMDNVVEQSIVEKLSHGEFLLSPEAETASQAQQILKLYADNHFEKSKIQKLFEKISGELKSFSKINHAYQNGQIGVLNFVNQLDEAEKIFEALRDNMSQLETIQSEITHISEHISLNSKKAVDGVMYYDFFEKTIDELVERFENINSLVKSQNFESLTQIKDKKSLEEIEKYYTMKSERLIHKNITGNQENDSKNDNKSNDTGNDVEFF